MGVGGWGDQGHGGQSGCFNQTPHTSSIRNFQGEVEEFVAVLGTKAEQKEAKYQFKKFSNKLKLYVL